MLISNPSPLQKLPSNNRKNLSINFIAGLVSGAGAFMWIKQKNTEIPVFQLKMGAGEKEFLKMICQKLTLKEKIYEYHHQNRHYVMLLVRKRSVIERVIIKTFNQRLFGSKKQQFEKWRDKFYQKKPYFIYKQTDCASYKTFKDTIGQNPME